MSGNSKGTRSHTLGTPLRGAGVVVEREDDAYRSDHKLPEQTVCPQCRATVHKGRWQWLDAAAGAREQRCPACQRIHDGFPAGFVNVGGDFFREHRVELLQLVEHRGEQAKAAHPLQRIMGIEDTADGVLITTTDIHLARGIADALHRAYQGELKLHYDDSQPLLRAHWSR
jgi:NMD protein affecting ribosome stability and mRNA decay